MSQDNEELLKPSGLPALIQARVALAASEWNASIVDELLGGCLRILMERRVEVLKTARIPGSFELPFACKQLYECLVAEGKQPEAIIALGCIIRGETPHFEYICQQVSRGIMDLNLSLPIPVIFGVLTVNTLEQARQRVGGNRGHKGEEAALSAIRMISFYRETFPGPLEGRLPIT